jgi:hypothetical protein
MRRDEVKGEFAHWNGLVVAGVSLSDFELREGALGVEKRQ